MVLDPGDLQGTVSDDLRMHIADDSRHVAPALSPKETGSEEGQTNPGDVSKGVTGDPTKRIREQGSANARQ
ncbi:hypothetical protein N7492_009664 [Penicillium capsulatum]|uniref:Uncharacterized protein n=1 Tax=Penicillium capsulatum TaxID=69766 RepID=A0A9W9HVQ3_9EURO|nr:hypothetical protein N7492_009664 [Penicillium capsulatum]